MDLHIDHRPSSLTSSLDQRKVSAVFSIVLQTRLYDLPKVRMNDLENRFADQVLLTAGTRHLNGSRIEEKILPSRVRMIDSATTARGRDISLAFL